jgi:copper chaperone CopZ
MTQHESVLATGESLEAKRSFTLPGMSHERDAQVVAERLGHLAGVRGVRTDVRRHRVTVVYDLTRLDCRRVLDVLADSGFPAPDTRWARLKTSWLQYLDENGRANANAPEAPCCSNPRGIAAHKK